MIAHINGEDIALNATEESLSALLARLGYTGSHFAVAVNGAFVAKAEREATVIRPADKVEVLAPMVGG